MTTREINEPCAVCISMPRSMFTDSNLENLKALIAAKGGLIKKALGVDDLPLEVTDMKVSFPWFPATPTPDEMNAYDAFICKLCEMARNQSRVNSSEKPVNNEKYAFRCFLLQLGFIGNEYKAARKILLKNLSGSSAFRNGGHAVCNPRCCHGNTAGNASVYGRERLLRDRRVCGSPSRAVVH